MQWGVVGCNQTEFNAVVSAIFSRPERQKTRFTSVMDTGRVPSPPVRSFIRKYIAHRRKTGIADATIRRELNPLRAMFNLASEVLKSFRQTKLLISLCQKILSQQVSTVKQATVN